MKIATFSNGYTDPYKGTRDVTAAWAIILKADGSVVKSGHSLDAVRAASTAEGNVRYLSILPDGHPLYYVYSVGTYRSRKDNIAAKAHNAARLDLIRSLITIEIVTL